MCYTPRFPFKFVRSTRTEGKGVVWNESVRIRSETAQKDRTTLSINAAMTWQDVE